MLPGRVACIAWVFVIGLYGAARCASYASDGSGSRDVSAGTVEQAAAAADSSRLIWPAPPAPPRVEYVGSITGPADLDVRRSWLEAIVGFVRGRRQAGDVFVKPCGVALDEVGNLCLTDTGANAVCFWEKTRREFRRWRGVGSTQFVSPVGVATSRGVIYVADSGLGSVLGFRQDGEMLVRISAPLQRPAGLAINEGRLYVADAAAHCVFGFDLSGRLETSFGRRGVGPGEFNFPTHIATDSKGHVYVTDSMNSRVQVFDGTGTHLGDIGSLGDGSGHFSRPRGVAVDRFGHVYVLDALFDNLQVFDSQGRFLLDIGSAGTGPGRFWMPAGLAVGSDDLIYVADSYNNRVQLLRYVGGE
jgi:DNA-binding beta-propeller fold protein YncE